jgi:hypothetical protein
MRRVLLGFLGLLGAAAPAGAAGVTQEGVRRVSQRLQFSNQGTHGPDEGVTSGSRFIIYDFAGLVAGSTFAPGGLSASAEMTSLVPFVIPGQSDDPAVENLVFTYDGPDFRTIDGPFAPFSFDGMGAVSAFQDLRHDAFITFTIKNNPDAGENTQLIHVGIADVPLSTDIGQAVPEPATWAMMIGGFGLIGAAVRRRRSTRQVRAA